MSTTAKPQPAGAACPACAMPLDARPFDDFSILPVAGTPPGATLVLATFTLPTQYCGLLQCFTQFTDQLVAADQYRTNGVSWSLRINNRPLAPYAGIDFIVNPWGWGGQLINLRLDESATVQLIVRIGRNLDPAIKEVGGRISGRYWYNELYGGGASWQAT